VQATVHPNHDLAPNITLPPGKVVGIDTFVAGQTWATAKQKGFTHKHTINEAGVAKDELFFTIFSGQLNKSTTYNGQPASTQADAEALASQMAGVFSAKSIFTDEFTDMAGAIPVETYPQVAAWFYSKFAELTNSTPATSNVMGGYMGEQNKITPNNFYVNYGGLQNPLHPFFVQGLQNQANARKALNRNTNSWADDHYFFQFGLHEKINLMTNSFVGMNTPYEDNFFYANLNEVQRKYLAGIKRTALFTAPWSQSVTWPIDLQGKQTGWLIERKDLGPDDAFVVKEWHISSTCFMQFTGFFGLLLADGWMMWDSLRRFMSKNPANLDHPIFANQGNWGEWYSPIGTPQPGWDTTKPFYPHRPVCNVDYSIAMIDWYMQVKDLAGVVKYLPYTTNGTSVSVQGSNPIIPTANNLNYGNTTLLQWANDRRGMCVGNKVGNDWFVAYFNPYKSPLETENIVANVDGVSVTFQARGRKLAVLTS
jgi:hypothetical protein